MAVKEELELPLVPFLSSALLWLVVVASDEIEILFADSACGEGACMVGMVGCCKNKSVCG